MKKLILISALLFSLNGLSKISANCVDTNKIDNLGYKRVQLIKDRFIERTYDYLCKKGAYLTFDSGEEFECQEQIPISIGENVILLSVIKDGIFHKRERYLDNNLTPPCAAKPEVIMLAQTQLLYVFNRGNYKWPLQFLGSRELQESYMLLKKDKDQTYGLERIPPLSEGIPHRIENFYYEDADGKIVIHPFDTKNRMRELIILDKNDDEAVAIKELFESIL